MYFSSFSLWLWLGLGVARTILELLLLLHTMQRDLIFLGLDNLNLRAIDRTGEVRPEVAARDLDLTYQDSEPSLVPGTWWTLCSVAEGRVLASTHWSFFYVYHTNLCSGIVGL